MKLTNTLKPENTDSNSVKALPIQADRSYFCIGRICSYSYTTALYHLHHGQVIYIHVYESQCVYTCFCFLTPCSSDQSLLS